VPHEPDDIAYDEFGKRCRVGPGEDRFGPDEEWIDPFLSSALLLCGTGSAARAA
jgi:hypothetical protein